MRLPAILAHGWHWLNLAGLLLGIALIGWGYIGFRSEMARLKPR